MSRRLHDINDLRADVAEILGEDPSQIADDDNLIDFGLDSIRLMSLAQRWSDAGVAIQFSELAEWPSISHWWALVAARRG